jgi:hypothetical protein
LTDDQFLEQGDLYGSLIWRRILQRLWSCNAERAMGRGELMGPKRRTQQMKQEQDR